MRSKAGYIIVTQLSSFKNKKRITVPSAIIKKKKDPNNFLSQAFFLKMEKLFLK